MEKHDKDNEPKIDIGQWCSDPYPCEFWKYCTRNLPTPNVFDIKDIHDATKFKKYYEGKISFEDLENEITSENAAEQIDFEINNRKPKIIKEEIKNF